MRWRANPLIFLGVSYNKCLEECAINTKNIRHVHMCRYANTKYNYQQKHI